MKELLLKLAESWEIKAKEANSPIWRTSAILISNSYKQVANSNFSIDNMERTLIRLISENQMSICLDYEQALSEIKELKTQMLVRHGEE